MTLEDHLFIQYIQNEGPRQLRENLARSARQLVRGGIDWGKPDV